MADWGLLPEGYVRKPQQQILDEVDQDLKDRLFGESAGTEDDGSIPLDSPEGQLKVLIVDPFADFHEKLAAVVAGFDPAQAGGTMQDQGAAIVGVKRHPASNSTVSEIATGTPGTVLDATRVVREATTGARFVLAGGTIAAATAWAALTAYVAGDIRTNNNRVYVCTTAGTSDASGGPTTQESDITDATVHWRWIGDGTGYVAMAAAAEDTGPVGALAGTLTDIATPVSGWQGAYNLLDADVGDDEESDSAFRVRRDEEVAGQGRSTVDAITADVLAVNEGSTDPDHEPPEVVRVFHNDTDSVDPTTGLPPHSVEVLALGGTDQDIAQAVWDSVGGGTATFGNQTATVVDSQGNNQTVYWSRPTEVPIWIDAVVKYDSSIIDDADQVEQLALSAILTWAAEKRALGLNVREKVLSGAVLFGPAQTDEDGLAVVPASAGSSPAPGVFDVTQMFIGTAPAPGTSTEIQIGLREIATYDSSRIAILATSGTP